MSDFIQITVEKYKNVYWKDSIRVRPAPKYRNLLLAMQKESEDRRPGETLNRIIKEYFDAMPNERRLRLIHRSKNHW